MSGRCSVNEKAVRVVAWRDPPPYRGLTTLSHIDSTGISLKVRQRCEYCNQWTIRYDTVECKPLHRLCQYIGSFDLSPTSVERASLNRKIYENAYVAMGERHGQDNGSE